MDEGIRFDNRMSDAEGLMWRLDKDPYLTSTIMNLSVLDRAPDFARLRRRMTRASIAIPRLRQRVQSFPANIAPPMWVVDPDFDIDYHVRRVALPSGGTMRDALDLATLIGNDPFDRTRPLWQFTVIENIDSDTGPAKAMLVEKLHHTIADGEGSVQLSLEFFDFARDAPEPDPLDPETVPSAPNPVTDIDVWKELLAGPLKFPIAIAKQLKDIVANPTSGIPAIGALTEVAEVDPARSPLWSQRTLRRRVEIFGVPFRPARDRAREWGGTLNTMLLTAAADAAGAYHRALGSPIDHLRASMAISTRRSEGSGNETNSFSLARMLVPTGDMDVRERFDAVNDVQRQAASGSASKAVSTVSAMASAVPTAILTRMARMQAQTVDFATSNVKGTPIPVYVAGSEIVGNYPVGPIGGVAFNLTLLSHVGSLDMGINIDAGAVSDPALLRESLAESFARLLA